MESKIRDTSTLLTWKTHLSCKQQSSATKATSRSFCFPDTFSFATLERKSYISFEFERTSIIYKKNPHLSKASR